MVLDPEEWMDLRRFRRHLRRVGKDCLISFGASLYSTPARRVRPGQTVEVRVTPATMAIHTLTPEPASGGQSGVSTLLAVHPRADQRGSWVVDERHWDGLPDGTGRATTSCVEDAAPTSASEEQPNPLQALLTRSHAARITVGRRSLATYDRAAGPTGRSVTSPVLSSAFRWRGVLNG
jgi:hypothetical protein